MNAYFLGYTQNKISWTLPKCPICGHFEQEVAKLIAHFGAMHSLKMPWWAVTVEDPRSPGYSFHFLVDDLIMAKQLNGVAIPLEPTKEQKPKKPIRKAYIAPPEPKKKREEEKPKAKPKKKDKNVSETSIQDRGEGVVGGAGSK